MIHNTKIREMVGTKSIHHHNSTSEDQMVWTSHMTANTPRSSTCIQHKIQWSQSKRTPWKTWINSVKEILSLYDIAPAQAFRRAADKRVNAHTHTRARTKKERKRGAREAYSQMIDVCSSSKTLFAAVCHTQSTIPKVLRLNTSCKFGKE